MFITISWLNIVYCYFMLGFNFPCFLTVRLRLEPCNNRTLANLYSYLKMNNFCPAKKCDWKVFWLWKYAVCSTSHASRFVGGVLLKPKFQSTFESKSWAFFPGDLSYSLSLCFPPISLRLVWLLLSFFF